MVSQIEPSHDSDKMICISMINIFDRTNFFHPGVKHYRLVMKDTPDWNRAIHKTKERDSDFLLEYVESRAIPWQFEFQNVKYRKT